MISGAAAGVLAAATLASCFGAPQPVRIDGWASDAMEPFISRDGRWLFFNSSNAPGHQTDLYWARRIDDLHFSLQGPVAGANSPALNGVPSLATDGTFSMISPRDYNRLHATIWVGRWTGAAVVELEPQPELAPASPGGFNMDAEVSADGQRLYFTINQWNGGGPPKTSAFRLARRGPSGWRVDPTADRWFDAINTVGLQYAAGLSSNETELFFTRFTRQPGRSPGVRIMVATRPNDDSDFGEPIAVDAIRGFAEAPSVAPDGAVYFHARTGKRFVIMRSPRTCR